MIKKIVYSFNQVGTNLLWQAFNTVAVFYYVSTLHVSGTAISMGMIVYGVVNAFLNMFAGYISDRTSTRFGRRIPYILFGSLPFALSFYLLFNPPHASSSFLLFYFLIFTFIFDLFFTLTALNVSALYPEMYSTEKDRSFVSAFQQLFGILGLIVGVALSKTLGVALGWDKMALWFGIIAASSLYISLYGSFENPAYRESPLYFKKAIKETFKNKRFIFYVISSLLIQLVTTLFITISSFYSKYVVALSGTQSSIFLGSIFLVAIPMSFVWAKLAVRYTAIQAVMVSTVLYAFISLFFCFDQSPGSVIVTGALLGIPVAGFMVLLNILLAQVIDYDERVTGKRREGMYLGMNGFIVRIGMSLQYAIMGIFFTVSHFDSYLTEQTHSAILGLRFLIGGLPLLLLLIALFFLKKYVNLGKNEPNDFKITV